MLPVFRLFPAALGSGRPGFFSITCLIPAELFFQCRNFREISRTGTKSAGRFRFTGNFGEISDETKKDPAALEKANRILAMIVLRKYSI